MLQKRIATRGRVCRRQHAWDVAFGWERNCGGRSRSPSVFDAQTILERCQTHSERVCKLVAKSAVGIDLGTTNSVVAVTLHGSTFVIPGPDNQRLTKSVVSYLNDGSHLVGEKARVQGLKPNSDTFSSIKRLIGRRRCELEERMYELLPFQIMSDSPDDYATLVLTMQRALIRPQDISADLLSALKTSAELYLKEKVEDCVISVPAYFGPSERDATLEAAKIAGLSVLRIMNEPAAAAVGYGFGKAEEEFVLVFDLGGGTLDISLLHIGDCVFEVLNSAGDNFLGGDDFDARVLDWILDGCDVEATRTLLTDANALFTLKDASESAKIALSSQDSVEIRLEFPVEDGRAVKIDKTLDRTTFEEISADLVRKMEEILRGVFFGAQTAEGVNVDEDDVEILLVGGGTQMPCISDLILRTVGKAPKKGLVSADEAVAIGAGLTASALVGDIPRDGIILLDETPTAEDIQLLGEKVESIIDQFDS